jgi:hypothetical protein
MAGIEAYRHFKDYFYLRLGRVVDEATGTPLTVYRCLREDRLYCRPEENFDGIVKTKNYTGPRFEKIAGYDAEIERERQRLLAASSFDVTHSDTHEVYTVRLSSAGEGKALLKLKIPPFLSPGGP